MTLVSTIAGLLLVLVVLRDVVHELFDPEDTGSLSRTVMHRVWRATRFVARSRRSLIHQAGAMVLLAVAVTWVALLALGFSLVYLPRLPAAFHVSSEIPVEAGRGFGTALYVSLASLTTLSSSDVVPLGDGVRLAAAIESMLGAALITAWISWVLALYPVLARRRAFARDVNLVRDTRQPPERLVREEPADAVAVLFRSMTTQTLRVASDLGQTRVSYYFQNRTTELALASVLPFLLDLAGAAEGADVPPAFRRHGTLLREAVESLLGEIGAQFLDLDGAPPREILRALAHDHLLAPGDHDAERAA